MANAKNKVVEGNYKGNTISSSLGSVFIDTSFTNMVAIDKHTVEEYDVLDSESKTSGTSAVSRATVGAFFLGPAGLLFGMGAKKKGIHLIAIQFRDGKKSLLEVDDKIHKAILKAMF